MCSKTMLSMTIIFNSNTNTYLNLDIDLLLCKITKTLKALR